MKMIPNSFLTYTSDSVQPEEYTKAEQKMYQHMVTKHECVKFYKFAKGTKLLCLFCLEDSQDIQEL